MRESPWVVPDGLWERVERLLPAWELRYAGRWPVDDRLVLSGILFVLHTGIAWEHLPQEARVRLAGPAPHALTMHRRRVEVARTAVVAVARDQTVPSSCHGTRSWPCAELARLLGMPPATLSAVLKRLEARGLVERLRPINDRRRDILALAAQGMETRNQAIERFPDWINRVRVHLPSDPKGVLEPMGQLEAALRAALAE